MTCNSSCDLSISSGSYELTLSGRIICGERSSQQWIPCAVQLDSPTNIVITSIVEKMYTKSQLGVCYAAKHAKTIQHPYSPILQIVPNLFMFHIFPHIFPSISTTDSVQRENHVKIGYAVHLAISFALRRSKPIPRSSLATALQLQIFIWNKWCPRHEEGFKTSKVAGWLLKCP